MIKYSYRAVRRAGDIYWQIQGQVFKNKEPLQDPETFGKYGSFSSKEVAETYIWDNLLPVAHQEVGDWIKE